MKLSWCKRRFLSVLRWLVTSFFDVRVGGLDKIPQSGPVILAGNHPNLMDGVVLALVSPRPVRFLVAADTMRGLAGAVARWMGAIPVDRSGGSNSDALRAALVTLDQGEVIGIFPEGKTSSGQSLLEFKKGVALLAHRSGAPVVPCAFEGTQNVLRKGALTVRPSTIQVCFGSSLEVDRVPTRAVPSHQVDGTLRRLREAISELWERQKAARPSYRFRLSTIPAAAVVLPLSAATTLASGRP